MTSHSIHNAALPIGIVSLQHAKNGSIRRYEQFVLGVLACRKKAVDDTRLRLPIPPNPSHCLQVHGRVPI